jgi:hypothetical protein
MSAIYTAPRPTLILPPAVRQQVANNGAKLVQLQKLAVYFGLAGGERGYNSTGDLLTRTSDGFDLNELWDLLIEVVNINNESRQTLVDFLTFPVTSPIERVPQAGTAVDFEIATEYGEPKGARVKLNYFNMAYDLEWYDIGIRYTWRFLATAPAAQIRAIANQVVEADNRNIFTKVMRTVFNPTNLSATIEGQAYTVYKFYNNDTTVPPAYKSNTFLSTHTHYFESGATTVDSGDVEQLLGAITEHGYLSSQGYRLVLLVNKQEGNQIRKFRLGQTNNNAAVANYDFIPSVSQPDFLLSATQQIVGVRPTGVLDGLEVIGSYADALIIQDDYIPAGYMVAFATGGRANLTNPVGFREHENSAIRGLQLVRGPVPDYPLIDSYYQRVFGTGIRQRGAGAVMEIANGGSYTTPTAYA